MSDERVLDVLPTIEYGTRPKVLLVGNGINLSFSGSVNTDKIIQNEWKKHYNSILSDRKSENPHEIWNLPFPLQVVVASKDHVQGAMNDLAQAFKDSSTDSSQEMFLKNVLDTGFDAILSTNYSLEFEKSTIKPYSLWKNYYKYKITKKQSAQQEQFGIFQCTELPYGNNPLLWHIHGTALRKKSMVIGQMYYGKLLAEIVDRAKIVLQKYKESNEAKEGFTPLSWVDYFLIGDVYVLGFRMDFSESDIWWLISYKKAISNGSRFYFYDLDIPLEKRLLLKTFDIETPNIDVEDVKGDNRFLEYYRRICNSIPEL